MDGTPRADGYTVFDGLSRVQARIGSIESRVALLSRSSAPAPALRAEPSAPAASESSALFSAAYDAASAGVTGALAGPARRGIGGFGQVEPPAELVAYGNGRVPPEALTPIGVGGHRLWGPAAEAFKLMAQDAAAEGVTIGVTDSYRPYEEQVDLAERKGLYREGGLAAVPGTSSHGWGMALDLDLDARGQTWMRDNGWMYGFAETTPREPWHWEYRPNS
jgi:zinc D-Ala-D-Ala carboxypeptidase